MITEKLFGDNSKRTKVITNHTYQILIMLIVFVISLFSIFAGSMKYKSVLKGTSTPIDTTMTFARSKATVQLTDIYTDKKKDVLIARFAMTNGSSTKLPYKGSDYQVYISGKDLDGKKETQVIFGKMSTDGDLFLIIPNPSNNVYSVYIKNTNFISSESIISSSIDGDSSVSDVGQKLSKANKDTTNSASVSKALSAYRYQTIDDISNNKGTKEYQIQSDDYDAITFRITLKPQFDTPQYKVKVINDDLITINNEFNFAGMFDKVFKESAVNQLQKQHDQIMTKMKTIKVQTTELENRLNDNPDDGEAKSSLSSLNSTLDGLQNQANRIADQITAYNNLSYDDTYFRNLQTKASVISTKAVEANK